MSVNTVIKPAEDFGKGQCASPRDAAPSGTASTASGSVTIIGGYAVHAAASAMPSMPQDQFDDLVASIAEHGLGEPVEFKNDVLVEGRHRIRAILLLRERGTEVELRTTAWQPLPGETVAEYVARKNLHRRHMTDSQRLQCAAELHAMADEERAKAGNLSGRIQPGEVRNPKGRNQQSVSGEGETDSFPVSDKRARNRLKTKRSAAGRLAKQAGATIHKARQAMKVQKHGTPEEIAAVKEGRKTQPEVIRQIDARLKKSATTKPKTPKPIDHPFTPTTPLQRDLLAGWVRLRDCKIALNERRQARLDMRLILDAEEAATKAAKKAKSGHAK